MDHQGQRRAAANPLARAGEASVSTSAGGGPCALFAASDIGALR
jgi:hypothetical protein